MSEKNIDSLCKAIKNAASSVVPEMYVKFATYTKSINSTDKILNLKFDLLKQVIEESKITGLESYKDFFKNSDTSNDVDNQKKINQSKIERVNLGRPINNWIQVIFMFGCVGLMKEFNNKVELSDVKKAIENEQKLNANNGFIKICKGIYKFTYGFPKDSEESAKILSYALNQFAKYVDQWANDTENLTDILTKIQDIQCEDEEFKGFKERLEYCFYDKENKEFKVNEDKCKPKETEKNEEIVDNRRSIRFSPPIANQDEPSEEKISTKKLFLLIATVIFLAAVIFFTINLILGFLAISQTLAIILATIVTIALVASLAISIKNDVINKPQCLGGAKSFIDLYQNVENIKEEPNLDTINKQTEHDNE